MNLGKSQSAWTRYLGREVAEAALRPIRDLREMRAKFARERTQVRVYNDVNGNIASLTLDGINHVTNTALGFKLYARFTANGGNWDVALYRSTGGSNSVATVTNLADGGTAALVAANSSGISGSITLGAAVVGTSGDEIVVEAVLDYKKNLPKIFTQTDSIATDDRCRRIWSAAYDQVSTLQTQAINVLREALRQSQLANDPVTGTIARGNEFNSANETSLVQDLEVRDGSGNVTRSLGGLVAVLSDNMADEGTGGEQDVVRDVKAAGAGSFDAANTGLGSLASSTPREKSPVGVIRWRCDSGVDDGNLGSETFSGTFTATDGSGITFPVSGLMVEKLWTGPRGCLVQVRLRRTYTKTNDGSNLNLAAVTTGIFTGENASNTNAGVLYWKVVTNGSNFDFEFYKDANLTQLVAKAANVAASAAINATEQNASGLTVAWTAGSAPVATTTGQVNCNGFVRRRSDGFADQFTVTITRTGTAGDIQRILGEEFDADLNSDSSGSESISDLYCTGGTFAPFVVKDL